MIERLEPWKFERTCEFSSLTGLMECQRCGKHKEHGNHTHRLVLSPPEEWERIRKLSSQLKFSQSLKSSFVLDGKEYRWSETPIVEIVPDICRQWDGPICNSKGYSIPGPFQANRLKHFTDYLFNLIDQCPNLLFLAKTEWPERIRKVWPDKQVTPNIVQHGAPRYNTALGVPASTQAELDRRWVDAWKCKDLCKFLWLDLTPTGPMDVSGLVKSGFGWVRINTEWAYSDDNDYDPVKIGWHAGLINEQCQAAGVPVWCEEIEVREPPCTK